MKKYINIITFLFSFLVFAQNKFVFFDENSNSSKKIIKNDSIVFEINKELFFNKKNNKKLIGPYFFESLNVKSINEFHGERYLNKDKKYNKGSEVYEIVYVIEENNYFPGYYNLYKTNWLLFINIEENIIHCE